MNFKSWNIFGNVFDGVLATSISFEMFSPSGCSFNRDAKNALSLFHQPSCCRFADWDFNALFISILTFVQT